MDVSGGQQGDSSVGKPIPMRVPEASLKELVPSEILRVQDVPAFGRGAAGGSSDWHVAEWDDVYWTVVGDVTFLPDLLRVAP